MFPGFERWAQDTLELYDQESLELRELYQGGHDLGVLHRLVREQPEQVVLSESAYQALMAEFGDLDAESYVVMARDSGDYYIYCGLGRVGCRRTGHRYGGAAGLSGRFLGRFGTTGTH